jgi:hypothetical protein
MVHSFSATHCQARPTAARAGYREDMQCATNTSSNVVFAGACMAVCRIHQAVYLRWGVAAEAQAVERWGWVPEAAGNQLAEAS